MVQQQRTGQIATVEIRWDSWDRDVTMEAGRARSLCHVGSLIRSRSEGTLIEPDDDTRKKSNGIFASQATKHSECTVSQPKVTPLLGTLNPFWNKLAGSNPFLDYMHGSTEKNLFNVSNAKQDPENLKDINNEDSVSTSSDEGNVGNRLKYKHKVRNGPGRWRSASEILDELERKESKLEKYHKPPQPILNPDFEWLKNDREAYKMAWLSHRQLTRSCLDLGLMSQSPGWAQTQATDAMAACKIDHNGGMVSLPDSQNSICIPEGHVHPGEVQEVSFKVNLDPPHCLNTLYTATMSPLLEVRLSNLNTKEGITLELKLDGIVKNDPLSQVMTTLVSSPTAAPVRSEKVAPKQLARRMEMARSSSIPEEPRMEYLLEYFKGDTLALLSREMVRSIGNFKEKQWYIGFCRGRTGLIHCKNIKIITREQVLDFTGINITTDVLLYNMTLPFKKLTYMYSAIQTLVTSQITSWRTFADALGYSNLSLDAITHRHTENEADKVACVLEKLKEDCHAEKSRRKFQHELMIGLLKMDYVSLVALLMKNTVILSTAVELGIRWRELAEKFGKLNSAQIANYEAPHAGKTGEINAQSMWKPAYDFLYSWSMRYGDSYKDMIQDLHLILDKMKNPVTRQWRQLTGALITVNCLEALRFSEYP
uniref:ZU5 domain-containing protein n=1 Tax=Gadus morhua TaxID=8049 RepID=A0A8C5BZ63_GADMO